MTSERRRPRISASEQTFATVFVGADKKKFVVHESLLTTYSDFFRKALTGKFKEAEEKTVHISDDDAMTFEFFVHWLYHQRLPDSEDDDPDLLAMWKDVNDYGMRENMNRIHLYVFGDRNGIPGLQNDCMDAFFVSSNDPNTRLRPADVRYAFDHLQSRDPLIRFLVDYYCSKNIKGMSNEWGKNAPPEFVRLVAIRSNVLLRKILKDHGSKLPILRRDDYLVQDQRGDNHT